MDKEEFIKTVKNLYNLTLLFPKKEPLRYKMRELADDILDSLISALSTNPNVPQSLVAGIEKDLEVLDSFFEVAKSQNWVSISEILNLQKDYSKVKEDFEKFSGEKNISETETPKNLLVIPRDNFKVVPGSQISLRQEKILDILKKEKEKLQVKDLKDIFPQVSKRTFRRDFERLTKKGLVIRIGEKNNTFYQLPDEVEPKLG
ncbi:MAG TPA: DeoR family transcriptional regulator [Candidatus Nealsonbacteria bacterium]|uniref:HTH deoR-type domain-containing protein n=1 Tax=marine sediment metagenome TaxID=412755 RepID=A0A0F9S1M4_9ZZZZ|nr:DeoR family transcriptional regulator [Candidatus Nealsonbacteria bacterium]HEB46199.1 DeoR family transcriptional regulator [Candidatus Nealsonbacteria bacterium]